MKVLAMSGEVVLHRDNDSVVFWIGDHLVAKASTGDARTELEHESAILDSLRSYDLPVVRIAPNQRRPVNVGRWSVLFTERLRSSTTAIELTDLLRSLSELHRATLDVQLPDWTAIVAGAERCRQLNPFMGGDAALMDKVYELAVLPAMERPHSGQALHGDADFDQAISTPSGIVWIDFETACLGPIEWDLAAFDDVTAYGPCDLELWEQLRVVHSWCVASWCNRRDVENPSRRAARNQHLKRLAALV